MACDRLPTVACGRLPAMACHGAGRACCWYKKSLLCLALPAYGLFSIRSNRDRFWFVTCQDSSSGPGPLYRSSIVFSDPEPRGWELKEERKASAEAPKEGPKAKDDGILDNVDDDYNLRYYRPSPVSSKGNEGLYMKIYPYRKDFIIYRHV